MIRVAVKFGAFVAVCLLFTLWLAFTIGNLDFSDPLGRNDYTVTAAFDDVTGLLVDDNVKISGVVVGKVTDVSTEDGRAVVEMAIDDHHDGIPRQGTSAGIRWRNLIGQRYVYLYPGERGGEALEDGDEIDDTVSVVDLGELFNRLGPIVTAIEPQQVNKLLETLTQAFDGREDEIGGALDDLATLAQGLASRDDVIQRLIANLDTVAATLNRRDVQIEAMLQNLVTLSQSFGDNTETLDAALRELGQFGTNLSGVLERNGTELDRLLGNLALVTDTVRSKLPQLDSALSGLTEASRAVFRAGNRGEMLNQKIFCVFVAPPASSEAGCPTGDPITGLSTDARLFAPSPVWGADAITSLLRKAVGE
jgi:virulence factor Mce-like protein